MKDITLRSLLVVAIVICDCVSWSTSKHHYGQQTSGHRSRHRRQGARLYLPGSYVLPEGEGYGAWGPWGDPSSCSRTCGGGVAYQQRICLEITPDGRPRCVGGDKKYFSCNTQDCPEGSPDFRSVQCSEYDNVSIKNTTYNWVPYTKAPNPCELNCMPRGERFYYRHQTKVVDGTLCNSDSLDVCVDGTCQPVGCDMMLGSNAKEDKCRECRGNGTSCQTIADVNNDQELRSGYNDILWIPARATSIFIKELQPSNNYLAIRSTTEKRYYLNGDYRIDFPRRLEFAGAVWHYERSPQGFPAPDILKCQGPTTEPVYLSLLLLDVNLGVQYEYSVPTGTLPPPNEQYSWVHEDFTPCSATCGGGFQTRNVTCRSRQELAPADEGLCDLQMRPVTNQTCASNPCAARWVEGPWGPCSQPCGTGGSQSRQVHCEKIIAQGLPSVVNDDECFSSLGPKPDLHRRCNEGGNCPKWHTGPWKPCDKLCGEGKQSRNVTCFLKTDGRIEKLTDAECSEEKPMSEQQCMLHPCEGVDWTTSSWSGCDSCVSKVRTRTAYCLTKDKQTINDTFCSYHKKPTLEEECNPSDLPKCPDSQWYAGQWSTCSTKCGKGEQKRKVFCANGDIESGLKVVSEERCDAAAKYNDTQECGNSDKECPALWHAAPWSTCSHKCGTEGEQYRKVVCLRGGVVVDFRDCMDDDILPASQSCNRGPCEPDETLPVRVGSTQPDLTDEDEECIDEDYDYNEEGLESFTTEATGSTDTDDTDSTDLSSTLSEEDLMLSDAPSSTSDITGEGSGDTDSTKYTESESTLDLTTGSGETETISVSTESLPTDFSLDPTGSTELESTDTGSTETESSDASTESTGSSTDSSGATDSSSESSTDAETEGSTESSASTGSSLDISATTESASTDSSSGSTDSTLGSTDSSSGSSGSSSESTETSSGSTDSSLGSTDSSSESTESSSGSTDSSTDSSVTTDETTDESTETTETVFETELTTDASTTESSTDSSSTESTDEATDQSTTEGSSTEGSTVTDESTIESEGTEAETKETGSTESTVEESSTETGSSTDSSTEVSGSSEGTKSTEPSGSTAEGSSTEGSSTEVSATESSTSESGSTEPTTESSSEGSEGTGSTESEGTTESGSTTESEPTEEGSTTEGGSTMEGGTSTEGESTTEGSTSEEWSSTEGGSTTESSTLEEGSSTEGGSTTEGSTSEEGSSTEGASSSEGSTMEEMSTTKGSTVESTTGESSSWSWETTVREIAKTPRTCRPRRSKCAQTVFGCCSDNKTEAGGPFDEGCPIPETCKETPHGCCADGVSPASGPKGKGCPSSHCEETLFGCCKSDNSTPAEGNDQEGCPPPPPPCKATKFGCCKDQETEAKGPKGRGCPENAPKPKPQECGESKHGCCHDNVTAATGPNGQGCPCNATEFGCCPDGESPAGGAQMEGCVMSCNSSAFGCCPDGETPAHGRLGEGCCLATSFGCCPDNINPAQGSQFQGCGCQWSPYGCCPDNETVARGYNNEGCGCKHTPHGCCPNRYTPALGPNFEGCPCYTYQFGCCPDGKTVAKGPQQLGCRCTDTEFGCCGDGQTPAQGPEMQGCDCSSSKYGCCPDGQTEAQGDKFLGCTDVPKNSQAACGLDKQRGSCRNYTVRWFYDTVYGGCSRFWYGGCEGNDNRFMSQEECQDVCVKPQGKDACKLPKVKGVCEHYNPRWYYDADREVCGQFVYGGCLGNANNFETRDECQSLCEEPRNKDQCGLPIDTGSCRGNFVRWGYDAESKRCSQFVWGGCEGNANRFASESACIQQCDTPGTLKDECRLPREIGNCTEKVPKWFFDQGENRCMPYYYTGCGGNDNQFDSERECEERCPKVVVQDMCTLPALVGECSDYRERWYFDSTEERCRQFYWGGCGGNGNNFPSEGECLRRCVETPTTTVSPVVVEPFRPEFCFLEAERGPCTGSEARYYYEQRTGSCRQFVYGGCGGNRNSFPTREHCNSYCGNVQDLCQLPMLVGPCEDSIPQYYYDARSDACVQFAYSGCEGNQNKFNSRDECESRCKTAPVITTSASTTTSTTEYVPDINARVPEIDENCRAPPSDAICGQEQQAWYYNERTGGCTVTLAGACGYRGLHPSEEACERSCGIFKGLEVCRYQLDPGLCRGAIPKIYFDAESGHCLDFLYGGCGGGPNRFSSVDECESVCAAERSRHEPEAPNCALPVDSGQCPPGRSSPSRRWFYSEDIGSCQVFVYVGCAGNTNNFKSHEECVMTCRRDEGIENEIPEPCDTYRDECSRLTCDFGVERRKTEGNCEQCVCAHPCTTVQCREGERCAVLVTYDASGARRLQPVCRISNKEGVCPYSPSDMSNLDHCQRHCNDDADCKDSDKCCARGCSFECVAPQAPTQAYTNPSTPWTPYPTPTRTYTNPPTTPYYRPEEQPSPPQVDLGETPSEVASEEGGLATLRCVFNGYPAPTITWQRGALTIDGTTGRYRILTDGALQIVSVYRNDTGVYVCIGDNGLGQAKKELYLDVKDPVRGPAHVVGEKNASIIGTLYQPLLLRCSAYGYPPPDVWWWKGDKMLPFDSQYYEINRDGLTIRRLEVDTLGVYTCQAFNGEGKSASWSVTVRAYKPADGYVRSPWLVTSEGEIEVTPRSPIPPTTTQRTLPTDDIDPNIIPDVYIPPVYNVPISTSIVTDRTTFPVRSELSLLCSVDGNPQPRVYWSKDGTPLDQSNRIHISDANRLTIEDVTTNDSGVYTCHASNDYSSHSSYVQINVEGLNVHPNCTDNPFFANCKLIVSAKYCRHEYYAKFCCRSCTLAGQLSVQEMLSDQPKFGTWRKK